MTGNVGKRVVGRNRAGVILRGRVVDEVFVGDSSLVRLDLDGTTSTIEVDVDDFKWREVAS